jgi:hypothetical protein
MEIQMQVANSENFVNMLSEEKPVLCFFHRQKEDAQVPVIKQALTKLEKQLPLLPLYEFITDATPANKQLCDIIEIVDKPVLVIYKNGNFSRYKDKQLNEKSIAAFLGNKSIYQETKEDQEMIDADL